MFGVSSGIDRTYGRDVMPKDATKNIDRYKVRGGDINEFEFHKNQEQFLATKGTKGTKGTKRRPAVRRKA